MAERKMSARPGLSRLSVAKGLSRWRSAVWIKEKLGIYHLKNAVKMVKIWDDEHDGSIEGQKGYTGITLSRKISFDVAGPIITWFSSLSREARVSLLRPPISLPLTIVPKELPLSTTRMIPPSVRGPTKEEADKKRAEQAAKVGSLKDVDTGEIEKVIEKKASES